MSDFVPRAPVLVLVGPGGVGKTTVAAALGVSLAMQGKRVAVLTVDPARRLAGALGLDQLHDELRPVALPRDAAGTLHAAMLETGSGYDDLLGRLVTDAGARESIFGNAVYRSFSRTLARSHAYLAMERLHDLVTSERFDHVVLDTPPTRSALEILDAPGRLARFLDDEIVRWFLSDAPKGRLSRLLPLGGAAVARVLSLLTSPRLVDELKEFFTVMGGLADGFRARATATADLLTSSSSQFLLVTGPSATSLADARHFAEGLAQRGVGIAAVVLNRMPEAAYPAPSASTLAAGLPDLDRARLRSLHDELVAFSERTRLCREHAERAVRASGVIEPSVPSCVLSEQSDAPLSVVALAELGRLLTVPGPAVAAAPKALPQEGHP